MTAAEELTQAADKLNALIAEATDGPWISEDTGAGERADVLSYEVAETSRSLWAAVAIDVPLPNAAYIAAMNPLVGKALAEWLRAEAARLNRSPAAFGGAPLFKPQPEAMALARLINGSAT